MGFVSKYLQTDMAEGCILLSNLFGFDEISDVRLRPYIEAAEQRQRIAAQQQAEERHRGDAEGSDLHQEARPGGDRGGTDAADRLPPLLESPSALSTMLVRAAGPPG